MPVIALPHEATESGASVWIGCDEAVPPGLKLTWTDMAGDPAEVALDGWQRSAPVGEFHYWLRYLDDLAPGTTIVTVVDGDGKEWAETHVGPLPQQLPPGSGSAFRVLVGSCFSRQGATAAPGAVRQAMDALLQAGRTPDLTILCGDQVYLDTEVGAVVEHTPDDYWPHLLRPYLEAWGFGGDPSLRPILEHGASWFTPDDHEWWNNFPEWAPLVAVTWDDCWAQPWTAVARHLIAAFQPRVRRQFDAGGLSFFVADTRTSRSTVVRPNPRLFDPDELTAITDWIGGLTTPGVLLLAQPFFQDGAGVVLAAGVDAKLADFGDDFAKLATALDSRPTPIVIVAGDVHYSRVATTSSLPRLVEVVSSPIALLPNGLAPSPADAFDPGLGGLAPTTHYLRSAPGFMLLEFGQPSGSPPSLDITHVKLDGPTIHHVRTETLA